MRYKSRIFLGFVLLITAVEAVVIGIDIFLAHQERRALHDQSAELLAAGQAIALTTSLGNFDGAAVAEGLEGLSRAPGFLWAELRHADGSVAARAGGRTQTGEDSLRKIEPIRSPREPDRVLGELELALSMAHLDRYLTSRLLVGAGELAVLGLVNVALVFLALNWMTGPLTSLARVVHRLSRQELDLEVPAQRRQDEIGDLARAVEVVRRNGIEQRVVQGSLERRIAEQTASLAAAKERAAAADRAKDFFVARVSHQIRTPLNSVIGLTALLQDSDPPPQQRDYLQKIRASAASLLNLVDDVLDISKMEAGGMSLDQADFDLDRVLDELADLVGVKADSKGLEVAFAVGPDVPRRLRGDPLRLRQVLLNLVNNAIQHTDRGEILVRVELLQQTAEFLFLRFTVRDTGAGIAEDEIPRLFQRFAEAGQSPARLPSGAGLGLAISKRLVELMHGEISVESRRGQGSSFHFSARLYRPEETGPPPRVAPENLRGLRVLVADDSALARKILRDALAAFSFRVTAVPSGTAALGTLLEAQLAGEPYRLVLLDWKMPELDGLQTARRIRTHRGLTDQPAILLVSAYDPGALDQPRSAMPINGFVSKPVSQSTLFNSVLEAMGTGVGGAVGAVGAWEPAPRLAPGTRLLLVEDNEINRQIALDLLRRNGLEVRVASDGAEASTLLQRETFAAVLMDIEMPVMDGLQATQRLRADPRFKDLPVIAMTAHAMDGDAGLFLKVGMNDYISKPVTEERLLRVLHRWLPEAPSTAGTDPPPSADSAGPPSLPGFDLSRALRQVAGNRRLLERIVGEFFDNNTGTARRLEELLAAGDREQARFLAHTLKGEALAVAAVEVADAAEALERSLSGGASWRQPLSDLRARLEDALRSRERWASPGDAADG